MEHFWEEFDRYRAFLVRGQQEAEFRIRSREQYVQQWDEEWTQLSSGGNNVREEFSFRGCDEPCLHFKAKPKL